MVPAGNREKLYLFRARRRIQYAIEYRPNQQVFKSIEHTYRRHEQDGRQDVSPVRQRVAQEPRQLPHVTLRRGWLQTLAAGVIGMECKPLFYLSCHHWTLPFQLRRSLRAKFELYFGLSR